MLQPSPKGHRDIEVPYLRSGSLDCLDEPTAWRMMYCDPGELRAYRLETGDLLVAEGGEVGRAEFAPEMPSDAIFQNSLHRLRLRADGDIRFVRYALESVRSSGWLDVLCNKTTFGHLTVDKLRQLRIPWPSPFMQAKIADMLDKETSSIDRLVANKRRLVRLRFLRFQLSVHTRTCAYGHYAPLRRYIEYIKTGTTPSAVELESLLRPGIPWLSPGDIGEAMAIQSPTRTLAESAILSGKNPEFPNDSTLIVGIGATAGRVGHNVVRSTGNQQLTCLKGNKRVCPRFLSWQLWSRSQEIRATAPYTTLPILNNDFLLSLPFCAPPLGDQQDIAMALDGMAARELRVKKLTEDQIALLMERRRTLVASHVAGRDAAA